MKREGENHVMLRCKIYCAFVMPPLGLFGSWYILKSLFSDMSRPLCSFLVRGDKN